MPTSYNGWPASVDASSIGVVPFTVAGVPFPGGVREGDVATVLRHVALQFHERVEQLVSPGCWGWSYRPNKNDPSELSCHASGTAIDCNAPSHPNKVEASQSFTKAQIAEIHKILTEIPELADVVHWGGDWHFADGLTPDPMHFEIHDHDLAKLARVAQRIEEADVALTDQDIEKIADAVWARVLKSADGNGAGRVMGFLYARQLGLAAAIDELAKGLDPAVQAAVKKAIADGVVDVDITVHDQTGD